MSKIAEFYAKVMTTAELRSQLANILQGKSIVEASDAQLQKIGEVAKSAGFELDLEEAKAYIQAEEMAVSDEALDAVAGGNQKGHFECHGKNAGNKDDTSPDLKVK